MTTIQQLEPWYFDGEGTAIPGTGQKKGVEPYVRFDLIEINGIPIPALAVWILLLRQWHSTRKEWVSIPQRVRQKAGVSQRRVSRSLAVLDVGGFIELKKETGKSTQARKISPFQDGHL